MNLYMKQRVFTWSDRFSIYDEEGREVYSVRGELFSWGKRLHVYDSLENEVAYIQQKIFTFRPRYTVFRNGAEIAQVVQEFTFLKPRYTVEGLGWDVRGNVWGHEYEMTAGGRSLVHVSKAWLSWGDSYQIQIDPAADAITALSVVLVIDACIEAQNDH